MKLLVSVVLVLMVQLGWAQGKIASFAQIDGHVQSVPFSAPDTLAYRLTAPYATDLEKVRAIFRWITDNIAYNVSIYPRTIRTRSTKYTVEEPYDSIVESKGLDERIAYSVLRKKVALCNGYARLFKTLCDYAGIRSEVITGYARSNIGSSKFKSNHTWNAVLIDSAWHLLDATWASGFLSYGMNEFVRQYNDLYFLTPPQQMIRSHYPEDLRWSLLPNPPTLHEYRNAPFRPTAFIKYTIKGYKPSSGIIEAAVGDTLHFELESSDVTKDRNIAADGYYDSTLLLGNETWAFVKPQTDGVQPKTTYTYVVTSPTVGVVHLLYNNDVVLRYRLNVKPKETATPLYNVSLR